jgi:hypothetical protein
MHSPPRPAPRPNAKSQRRPKLCSKNHDGAAACRACAAYDGPATWETEIRERYLRRMWDISLFLKTLKQRFTQSFNKTHKRKGMIWEERLRSPLASH